MDSESPSAGLSGRDNDGPDREFSAGGVLVKGGQVLLVKVRNLRGELVWTFPKGHVEPGETAEEAARREVEEETGYRCRILAPAFTAKYRFQRNGRLISKQVKWYWMEAGARLGKPDAAEIVDSAWATYGHAKEKLRYSSDQELLGKTVRKYPSRKAAKEA